MRYEELLDLSMCASNSNLIRLVLGTARACPCRTLSSAVAVKQMPSHEHNGWQAAASTASLCRIHESLAARRFLSHMRSRISLSSVCHTCSGDLNLLSQCVEFSSADPPWKQLLRELDDPSCPMKYR